MADSAIRFQLNDRSNCERELPGTTTLLRYLRDRLGLVGTKEGCAEGDCGACTVVVVEQRDDGSATYRAINSCLVFLPMLQGKRVYTVEALRRRRGPVEYELSDLHPVQTAMVDRRGSQCGYCTPGIVMSLFEACYRDDIAEPWQIDDQLCGNLCRCTGYRPIREAGTDVAGTRPDDRFLEVLDAPVADDAALPEYRGHGPQGAQQYLQPASLDALFEARAAHPDAVLVAGGTDLGLEVTKRHRHFATVIGLEAIASLRQLRRTDAEWQVGATVSLTRVMETVGAEIAAVDKMLRVFGSRQIRSRATLGNLVNASPIGDMAPVLLALGATVDIAGPDGNRSVPITEFFTGYRQTALRDMEILTGVRIPHPVGFTAAYKVSKRRELDISTVAAGMSVQVDDDGTVRDIALAYGGVAAVAAARAHRAEAALLGGPWSIDAVDRALPLLDQDFTPIDDARGSARYRSLLVRNLLIGFFLESTQRPDEPLEARPVGTVAAVRSAP